MKSSDTLLEKLKSEHIKPIPKWRHSTKLRLIWLIWCFSVIIGALAFSIILYVIQQVDFNLITHMSHSWFEMLLGLIPFFWIVSLIIFLIIASISMKNSRKGYKLSYSRWVAISTAFSILLGTLFFMGHGAQWLEHAFSVRVGIYENVQAKKVKIWMMPEEGYLSGTIILLDDTSFQLKDFNSVSWTIDYRHANFPPMVILEEGEIIKMVGRITSANHFRADEIRPWGGVGQFDKERKKTEKNERKF